MRTYANFEVWVESPAVPLQLGHPLVCPVHVVDAPDRPASGTLSMDLSASDFQNDLNIVRGEGADLARRKSFGARLYRALFNGDVRDVWMNSLGRIDGQGWHGLRLRLRFDIPQLAALPWELLYDVERGGFLATDASLAIARYLPVSEPPFLEPQKQLRILVIVEAPQGLPPIQPSEVDRLTVVMQALKNQPGSAIDYHLLRNPTHTQIQNALQQCDYHVLHFLGHGTAGQLAIVDADGQTPSYLEDEQFAQLFLGRRTLRLIVLNACGSSQIVDGSLFSGIGPALVQKHMPAVIAMQYPSVLQDTAGQFSQALYGALANGLPVDVAVNQARQLLSAGVLLHARDWSTPVLYLGTRSGFMFMPDHGDTVEQAWQSVQVAVQQSAAATAALADLSQRLQQFGTHTRALGALMRLSQMAQNLQRGVEHCVQLIGRVLPADLDMVQLGAAWQDIQQVHWAPLQVFVQEHPNMATAPWYPALAQAADAVTTSLARGARLPTASSVNTLELQVAGAIATVTTQMAGAMEELIALSDRTLGRLNM